MKDNYVFNINQENVTVTIDICSWAYPHYGLQLTAKLESTGEKITLNSNVLWKDVTEKDIMNLCESLYLAKPCNCGKSRLRAKNARHETNRGDLCEVCFIEKLNKEWIEEEKKEKEEIRLQDKKMKDRGCKYKVTAWIHNRGNDTCVDIYFPSKPTKKDIEKQLKKSVVKDDYTIVEL